MKDSNNKLVLNTIKAELGTVIAIGTTTAMIGGGEEIPSTLGNGLIAHYKMNDVNCTTVVDSAGNNDGSGTCTSVAGATANTGTALSFNGSQVGMSAPSNSDFAFGTGDFGIAFWIYATSFDAWSAIFGQSNSWSQSGGWIIQAREGNRIGIGIPNINDNLPSSGSLNINQWNSVIIFRNSGIVSYYYNGNLVDSKSYTASWDLKNYLLIGNGGMSFRLDDLRIYNRFLTTDEISELAAGTEAE
jgi:hypothetical protein